MSSPLPGPFPSLEVGPFYCSHEDDGAAAIGAMMLMASFVILAALNGIEHWARHRHGG